MDQATRWAEQLSVFSPKSVVSCISGGVLSNSLALFTDVLHLASDLISFLVSLLSMYLAKKSATKRMSFGYYRAGETIRK